MALTAVKYMLLAQDMERAINFYQKAIGLTVDSENPYWSELKFGDAIIALHGGHDGSTNTTGLSLQFADVSEAYEKALAQGGRSIQQPSQQEGEPIILATVQDPEGNVIMLTQYVG